MKLTSLFIQYLYTNQRLDLPGIGSFTLDRTLVSNADNPKHRVPITEGITFESKPGLPESAELISYISAETGKMKSLASADLESRMELVRQFLNLGKPFTFEGLGTLVRRPTGEVEFTPAFLIPEPPRATAASGQFTEREEPVKKYESFLAEPRRTGNLSKPVIAGLVIGGIVLAIAAGYFISRPAGDASSAGEDQAVAASAAGTRESNIPVVDLTDTVAPVVNADTPGQKQDVRPQPADRYKYVLEVANSARAFKRYKQLRTNLWNVELETKDSVDWKLFLMLPSLNADTTHIMDSLTVMLGRPVHIEQQN